MSNEALTAVAKSLGREEGPAKNTFRDSGMRNKFRERIWGKTDGFCFYCGCRLKRDRELYGKSPTHNKRMCEEHMIPRTRGGDNAESNIVPSCYQCNSRKGTRTAEEYRVRRSMVAAQIPLFTNEQMEWLLANGFVFPEFELIRFYGETL